VPVFISYSHKDKEFVEKLALNLIRDKTWVWLDEWEIAAGESLIERIQSLIQGASVLVAVFSKAAVESIWCKREVTAGIQRELEEKKVLIVPAILEDCELPLFLRDKKFADFRRDFDNGLQTLRIAIAKFTNPHLGRIEGDEYHRDWSVDWGFADDLVIVRFTIVKHSARLPYSVLVQITIVGSEEATARYRAYQQASFEEFGELVIIESIISAMAEHEFTVLLEDAHARVNHIEVQDPKTGIGYLLTMESRRLGTDTGLDILMHGEEEIRWVRDMVMERVRPLTAKEQTRVAEIVSRNMQRSSRK
jgi:hypothetical protein